MNPQHQATAAATGTAGMLAIVLMGFGRLAGITVQPEMATALAMLLAPFVGMIYSRFGLSPVAAVGDQVQATTQAIVVGDTPNPSSLVLPPGAVK